jgi:hypothetical protein
MSDPGKLMALGLMFILLGIMGFVFLMLLAGEATDRPKGSE